MEILFLLIPISMLIIGIAIFIFGWAVKNGQYDDLDGPAHSILFDDDDDMIPDRNGNAKIRQKIQKIQKKQSLKDAE